jgi:hypothetical protein
MHIAEIAAGRRAALQEIVSHTDIEALGHLPP